MSALLGAPPGAIAGLVVFSFFTNLLMLTIPLYMLQVFDRVLSSRSVETLLLLSLVAIAALLTSALIETIRSRLLMRLGSRIYAQWGQQLLTEGGSGFSSTGFSRVRDLGEIKQFVGNGGLITLLDLPWIPLYLAVLFLFNPIFAWAALAGGLVIGAIVGFGEVRTRKNVDTAVAANAQSTLQADFLTKASDTIRALGMTERLGGRWESQAFSGLRQVHGVSARLAAGSAAARFVRMTLQIGVLGGAAYLVTQGELTPGIMIAGSILITRALGPIESMIGGWQNIVSSVKAYGRLQTAIEAPKAAPARAVARPAGRINLDRITVIQNRKTLLNNVSLLINPGEMVAITGPCGSGKSTLVKVMLGLQQPTLGKVFLDEVDISQLNPDALGQYIGYLAQEPPLFQGTIGENISRMDPDADPGQIAIGGRRAFAHERILRLTEGYETPITGSEQLPRGIRQRIALARAMYGDPRVIVLDEPEAFLDDEGEQALYRTLTALKKTDITTLIVTHKPQILAGADRVIRLRDGVVQAFGPPREVLPAALLKGVSGALEPPPVIEGTGKRLPEDAQRNPAGPVADQRQGPPRASGKGQASSPSPSPSPSPAAQQRRPQKTAQPAPPDRPAATRPDTASGEAAAASRQESRQQSRTPKPAPRSGQTRPPAPPPKPDAAVLAKSRDAATSGQLTLANWLDPREGALGVWVTQTRGRAGERYLNRLRTRLSPLLEQPLQEIDKEALSRWREQRLGNAGGAIIERAMQKRRFDADVKVLRECVGRAVEWEVLSMHPLVEAGTGKGRKAEAASVEQPMPSEA